MFYQTTLFAAVILWMSAVSAMAQKTFPLYAGNIPKSKPTADAEKTEMKNGIAIVHNISRPTLSVFLPAQGKANGTAVIVCPGGGYWINALSHEGTDVARRLAEWGITAFVLKYRIPSDATMENRATGPLQDAQQAIRTVRERAKEWNVNPDRLGIMGFSAGGHLASTAGTHYETPVLPATTSVRPDFMVLIYPVISFQDSVGHMGSRDQLLGKGPSQALVDLYSNELQVTRNTPPAFLVHAGDDEGVKPDNSILFYQALRRAGVDAELHIYQSGGHGYGMNNTKSADPWMDRLKNWLITNHWLDAK